MPGRRWRGGCGRPAASSAMTGSCRATAVRDHWACWPHLRVRAGRRGQQAAPDGSTPRQHCRRFGIVTAGAGSGGRVIRAHLLSFKTEASRAAPGASVLMVGSGMRLTVGRTAPGGIGKPVHFDRRAAAFGWGAGCREGAGWAGPLGDSRPRLGACDCLGASRRGGRDENVAVEQGAGTGPARPRIPLGRGPELGEVEGFLAPIPAGRVLVVCRGARPLPGRRRFRR